ncbi:hypothetical protein QR680_012794 [Steinernema hermaphroditum]|uniref:Uncharacterized protein n=1 Tax=Steinernema hermaphroditum TaxID=289476 RepID=A0AA39I5L2_9BILA|nr:hypothetical protein QR680_012794 [Steinernema hermaphroditum]
MWRLCSDLRPFFASLWIVLAPLLLSPLLFLGSKEASCVFCICLLTAYWVAEVVPIAVTSLLPLLLFPVLTVLSTNDTAQQYLKDTTMLFVVTLIAAIAVEECGLHRRIALNVLSRTGGRFSWSLAAFAVSTAFIFWMVDTAATALMIPIAMAALKEMKHGDEEASASSVPQIEEDHVGKRLEGLPPRDRGIWKCMVLMCGHASLIGGTGTITATGPNLIFRDNLQSWYPEGRGVEVTYLSWMAFAIPPLCGYLAASWLVLQVVFLGPKSLLEIVRLPHGEAARKAAQMARSIQKARDSLGPMTFAEKSTLMLYGIMIATWMLRDPGFATGWGALLDADKRRMVSDTCVGILIVFLFFAWPRDIPDLLCFRKNLSRPPVTRRALLTWEAVHRKLPWSVIFLIGSGFAISKAVQTSGLSHSVSCLVLDTMRGSTPLQIQATLTVAVTFVTECMSNSATASIFIPISLSIAETLRLHPLYLAIPSAIGPSFSFMFPAATAPNAIVYETGVLRMWEMAVTGFILNILCILITILNTNTWAFWFFGMARFPDGIPERNLTTSCAAIA